MRFTLKTAFLAHSVSNSFKRNVKLTHNLYFPRIGYQYRPYPGAVDCPPPKTEGKDRLQDGLAAQELTPGVGGQRYYMRLWDEFKAPR